MSKRSIDSDTPEGQSMMKILLQHLWAISHVILQQPFNLLSTPLVIPNILRRWDTLRQQSKSLEEITIYNGPFKIFGAACDDRFEDQTFITVHAQDDSSNLLQAYFECLQRYILYWFTGCLCLGPGVDKH
jgi:hypothetical protein